MANDKLLPCPFCGGEVKIIAEQIDARTVSYEFICQNLDCGSVTYFDYCDREEAISQWNTRKPMERILEQLEEYKYSHLVERKSERLKHCEEKEDEYCKIIDCFWCVWNRAIEIVKGGVENEID